MQTACMYVYMYCHTHMHGGKTAVEMAPAQSPPPARMTRPTRSCRLAKTASQIDALSSLDLFSCSRYEVEIPRRREFELPRWMRLSLEHIM